MIYNLKINSSNDGSFLQADSPEGRVWLSLGGSVGYGWSGPTNCRRRELVTICDLYFDIHFPGGKVEVPIATDLTWYSNNYDMEEKNEAIETWNRFQEKLNSYYRFL